MGVAVRSALHRMAAASSRPPVDGGHVPSVGISAVGVVGISSVTLMVLAFGLSPRSSIGVFRSGIRVGVQRESHRLLFERSLAGSTGAPSMAHPGCQRSRFRIFGYASREDTWPITPARCGLNRRRANLSLAEPAEASPISNVLRRKDGTPVWVLKEDPARGPQGARASLKDVDRHHDA